MKKQTIVWIVCLRPKKTYFSWNILKCYEDQHWVDFSQLRVKLKRKEKGMHVLYVENSPYIFIKYIHWSTQYYFIYHYFLNNIAFKRIENLNFFLIWFSYTSNIIL